jgi:flagellar motility protein MotE (MotC chaperone)
VIKTTLGLILLSIGIFLTFSHGFAPVKMALAQVLPAELPKEIKPAQNTNEQPPERPFEYDVQTQKKIQQDIAKEFDQKQSDLQRWEERLKTRESQLKIMEGDIEKKIGELKRVQQKLDELLKVRDDLEAKNLENLTEAYSKMAPADAAPRLKAMDRPIALKILMGMKVKVASKILSNLDPATAAQITEQLAKRQLD